MRTAEEMRGFAREEGDVNDDRPATAILLDKRASDKENRPTGRDEE